MNGDYRGRELLDVQAGVIGAEYQIDALQRCQSAGAAVAPQPAELKQSSGARLKAGRSDEGVGPVIDASRDVRPDVDSVSRTHFSKVAEQLVGIHMDSLVTRISAKTPGVEGDGCTRMSLAVCPGLPVWRNEIQAYATFPAIFLLADSYTASVLAAASFQLKRWQFL